MPSKLTADAAVILKMRTVLLPLTITLSEPVPVIFRSLAKAISPNVKVIVWGELKSSEKTTVSPDIEALTASRKLQSASQIPSFVSAVFVTVSVAA
jgi:hypothetical protein